LLLFCGKRFVLDGRLQWQVVVRVVTKQFPKLNEAFYVLLRGLPSSNHNHHHQRRATTMVHLASFLAGSAVSGTVFLVVYDQLSHRARLSKKTGLREKAEEKMSQAWLQLRQSRSGGGGDNKQLLQSDTHSTSAIPLSTKDFTKKWNGAVSYFENLLRRDD